MPFALKKRKDRWAVAGGAIGARYVNETATMNKTQAKVIQAARRRLARKHSR